MQLNSRPETGIPENRLISESSDFPVLFFKAIEDMYVLFQLCAESAHVPGPAGLGSGPCGRCVPLGFLSNSVLPAQAFEVLACGWIHRHLPYCEVSVQCHASQESNRTVDIHSVF